MRLDFYVDLRTLQQVLYHAILLSLTTRVCSIKKIANSTNAYSTLIHVSVSYVEAIVHGPVPLTEEYKMSIV